MSLTGMASTATGIVYPTRATEAWKMDEAADATAKSVEAAILAYGGGTGGGGGLATEAGLPEYVGLKLGPFDAKEGLYNFTDSSMRGREKIVGTRADRSTTILVMGSSTVAGYGAPGVDSWGLRMRDELGRRGCKIRGTGVTFAGQAKALAVDGEPDARWTFSASGVTQATGHLYANITNGNWAQFASDQPGQNVDIHYFQDGGDFTYSIDGGSAVAVATSGATALGKVSVTGLSNAVHTVRVTGNEAGVSAKYVGADVFLTANGLRVTVAGVGGSQSGNWTDAYTVGALLHTANKVLVPALTFISVGGNDAALGVAVSTFKTNIATTIDGNTASGSASIIVPMPHANPAAYTIDDWKPYVRALYELADEKDVPLLDMTYRWVDYATASANGLFGANPVHPNRNGHMDYAMAAGLAAM